VVDAKGARGRTLPCVARAHANVAHVARLHDVVECLHLRVALVSANKDQSGKKPSEKESHRLLNRRLRIEAVALQDVDVLELEPLEAVLYRVEDVFAAETVLVHVTILVRAAAPIALGK
jgi:hypothetical protein